MTKRVGTKKRISRVLGVNLWGRANDPYNKKNYRSGQHGTAARRDTTYGLQLRAKQKLKGYYANISETQFRNLFMKARRAKKDTAQSFVGLLESRLDAIVYRANFVPTMFAARQMVNHRHVKVNGKIVNIPSITLKPGDSVELESAARKIPIVIESLTRMERDVPSYINLDRDNFLAKYNAVPNLEDVPYPVTMDVNLVVEYYSR
ncbi:MAG: 30S ribosomal protein S4 [Rickettsiales bacterium]|jgi:small subunit ribosomal protein S4|nr:30S ribosomal protein S4 [Rickettsiales bacterium]